MHTNHDDGNYASRSLLADGVRWRALGLAVSVALLSSSVLLGAQQDIDSDVTLEDTHPDGVGANGLTGDVMGAYSDGAGGINVFVGRRRSITVNLKNSSRTFNLDLSSGGCAGSVDVDVDGNPGCDACVTTPATPTGTLVGANLQVWGENIDELAQGCGPAQYETWARLIFEADGDTWYLYWGPHREFSGVTPNPDSSPVVLARDTVGPDSTWSFKSTGTHLAALYRQQNPPHAATEYHGQFYVPFSGSAVAQPGESIPEAVSCDLETTIGVPECVCLPGAEICDDGCDNDGDTLVDCDDPDCTGDPACAAPPPCAPKNAPCDADDDCCSGNCSGKGKCVGNGGGGELGDTELTFVRGDANRDGEVDLTDSLFSLDFLFVGGAAPVCEDAVDANDDGRMDLLDPVYGLSVLFVGGVSMPEPYPEPGLDPTSDRLKCSF